MNLALNSPLPSRTEPFLRPRIQGSDEDLAVDRVTGIVGDEVAPSHGDRVGIPRIVRTLPSSFRQDDRFRPGGRVLQDVPAPGHAQFEQSGPSLVIVRVNQFFPLVVDQRWRGLMDIIDVRAGLLPRLSPVGRRQLEQAFTDVFAPGDGEEASVTEAGAGDTGRIKP